MQYIVTLENKWHTTEYAYGSVIISLHVNYKPLLFGIELLGTAPKQLRTFIRLYNFYCESHSVGGPRTCPQQENKRHRVGLMFVQDSGAFQSQAVSRIICSYSALSYGFPLLVPSSPFFTY